MTVADDFKCAPAFAMLQARLEEEGEKYVKQVKGIFCFKVKSPDGKEVQWIVDLKNGRGTVEVNGKGASEVTLEIGDQDLLELMAGTLNAQKAFFQGKLKIKGNMALAMKLQNFLKEVKNALDAKL